MGSEVGREWRENPGGMMWEGGESDEVNGSTTQEGISQVS